MKNDTAVLICMYNDIKSMLKILDNEYIRELDRIYIHVDGPKYQRFQDIEKNKAIKGILDSHKLKKKFIVKYLDKNVGIRYAIPSAVDWVLESNKKIIVLEDDVLPGPNLFPFMSYFLDKYEHDLDIGAISGYTQIPKIKLGPSREEIARLSVYPESYVWGTWKNRWQFYQDNIGILSTCGSTSAIQQKSLNKISAFGWRLNFINAKKGYLDTWAYRWLASLWEVNKKIIVPNVNLTEYHGFKDRSHTRVSRKWKEIVVTKENLDFMDVNLTYDEVADRYASKKFFHGTLKELLKLIFISLIYRLTNLKYLIIR